MVRKREEARAEEIGRKYTEGGIAIITPTPSN